MYKLKIISSTVRPGRKGPVVAAWVAEAARQFGGFDVEVLDLGEIKLPLMDEAAHPRLRKYEHEHTKKWSAVIDSADAFVFVTAEYDYNYPASLRNALEYLVHEWAYKAAGIVSYGGISAGTRAANALKGDLASLRMVPLIDMVNLPLFDQFIHDHKLVPNEITQKSAHNMFKEITRWIDGLKVIRENKG